MNKTAPTRKSGLGRGLSSLLGPEAEEGSDGRLPKTASVMAIRENPLQPRYHFDDYKLEELANSIAAQGVLQPVIVRKAAGNDQGIRYELVVGERRWRAARMAGLEEIPIIIREVSDREGLELAILENVQREDLNPLEEARGYARLAEEFSYTHDEIARRLGKSRVAVTNLMRLLNLPETVLQLMGEGKLSVGHCRSLLSLTDYPDELMALADRAAKERLSVRELEKRVQRLVKAATAQEVEKPGGAKRRDPAVVDLEEKLVRKLSTKVSITHSRGKGRIILEYADPAALERLTAMLLK